MAVTSFSPQREKQEEKQKAAIMAANTSEGLKPEHSESWCVQYMSDWQATVIPLLPSVFSINQESSILFCSWCTGLPRIFPLTFTGNASIEKTWKNADLISHTESQTPRDVRHIFSRVGSYVCSYKPSRGLFPELSGQQIPEGSSPEHNSLRERRNSLWYCSC